MYPYRSAAALYLTYVYRYRFPRPILCSSATSIAGRPWSTYGYTVWKYVGGVGNAPVEQQEIAKHRREMQPPRMDLLMQTLRTYSAQSSLKETWLDPRSQSGVRR